MPLSQVLIALVIVLAYCQTGEAIRCYSCSNIHDLRCSDGPFQLTRASAQYCRGSCVKYKGARPTLVGAVTEITRGCLQQQTPESCQGTQQNGVDVYGCTCNTDFCNGGARMSTSASVVVTSTLALLYTYMRGDAL